MTATKLTAAHSKRLETLLAILLPVSIFATGAVLLFGAGDVPIFASVTAFSLALALGARHAFDADHIASIDNAVRILKDVGKPSKLVGFYFSVGHSTVVLSFMVILSIVGQEIIAGTYSNITNLSTLFIASFLAVVVILNSIALKRQSGAVGGPVYLAVAKLLRKVSSQWQMMLVGLIFGLGLDTALALAIVASGSNVPVGGNEALFYIGLAMIFAGSMSFGDSINTLIVNRVYDSPSRLFISRWQRIMSFIIIVTAGIVGAVLWAQLFGLSLFGLKLGVEYLGFIVFAIFIAALAVARIMKK